MDIQDRKKSLTAEELRQRYNLEDISKNKKAIQMQKDAITKLDTHLEEFVEATTETLEELQDQVDGNITTWFYSGVPTLLNEPAVEWTTTEEKNRHLGDLYYDQSTGYAYRFAKQSNQYIWLKLTDSDVTEALRIANEAQDTADNKRRVFTTTPTTPYDVGDLWLNNQDLYVCSTARESGSYVSTDFEIATKYTDDSALTTFINGSYASTIQTLEGQIDGKSETYYQSADPSSTWTTSTEKDKHIGDLWYNTATNKSYIYTKSGSTYSWQEADGVPQSVYDKIDGKAQIFSSQPTPPYYAKDLWVQGSTGDIKHCVQTRTTGSYNANDWVLSSKYTDDSSLNTFVNVTYAAAMQNLTNQIDGKISTWYYDGVPTLSNLPASAWTTDEEKQKHTGDLYYNRETGYCYMFEYENSTYKWTRIEDSSITEALAVANAAQDTADNKRRVFVVQPTPPYDIGDIWIKEDKDLYRCKTATQAGGTFNMSHWILATNYTDDTVALQAKQELDQFKVDVQETYATNAELITTTNSISGRVEETYTYITTVENNIQNQIGDITTTTQVSTGKNSLYLEDTVEGNALSYATDGATEQQTYSGKNLFDLDTFFQNAPVNNCTKSKTETGIKITFTAGADAFVGYTGKTTGTVGSNIRPILIKVSANTTYTLSLTPSTRNSSYIAYVDSDYNYLNTSYIQMRDTNKYTFTTPNNTAYVLFRFGLADSSITTYTFNNIQLELGSTATTYEPYVGGIESPNPDFPQEVKTIPSIINLFDKDNANTFDGYLNGSNVLTSGGTQTGIYIPCQPNTTYTITKKNTGTNNRFCVFTTDVIPTIGVTALNYVGTKSGADNNAYYTITTPSNAKYLCVFMRIATTTPTLQEILDSIQIEESSVVHEYVPYGYWSKVKVTGKNIFDNDISNVIHNASNNALTQITNGVRATFTGTSSSTNRYSVMLIKDSSKLLGKTYSLSGVISPSASNRGAIRIYQIKSDGSVSGGVVADTSTSNTFTFPSTFRSDAVGFGILFYSNTDGTVAQNDYVDYTNIQLELGEITTTYEPYKENQVLIDMSKENLYDKTTTIDNKFLNSSGSIDDRDGVCLSDFIEIKPNTNYYVNGRTDWGSYGLYDSTKTFISRVSMNPASGIINIANTNTKYIRLNGLMSEKNNITMFEGNNPTPYYELCKIGDYKDTLSIDSSGNCVINKNVGKVVLNGGETIIYRSAGRFDIEIPSSSGAYAIRGLSDYYTYTNNWDTHTNTNGTFTIQNINWGANKCRMSFKNTDYASLNDVKTGLANNNVEVYYQITSNIGAPETITLPNTKIPLFEGINHVTFVDDLETDTKVSYYRNTPLSGTYATLTQLNEVSTEKTQEIQTVRNEVQTEISSTQASIQVINETIENGVSKVNGTGYTFDSEGLKIEKTNQDVKSLLDNDGLAVSYKGTDLLTVRSNGIEAKNMTVRKFYVQRPIRMEKTKSISDGSSVGLGFFYVGEE